MDFNKFVQGNFLKLHMKVITVSELVSFLQSNPNITKLSLERCNIGDEEAKALANGNLANLTQLDLSCNKIGDEGAKALADLIKVNVKGTENLRKIDNFINTCKQSNFSIKIEDPTQSESKTTLNDIIIPESLKKELNKILDIIPEKNKALLQKTGYKAEKGYLFYGPPGNGKTKIARAIACQANAKFISVSASEFLKSYIGEGEKYVREIFKKARANAPCIIFIDEIDCIATERGSGGSSSHAQSCDSLVNQFLTELDGFNSLEDVTVIAATNRKDILDKAFIRPGRLSNHIEIPLPGKTQREKILNLYIKKFRNIEDLEVKVDAKKLANETDGFSGAELEYLINSTGWDIICSSKIEEKVTIQTNHFIKVIKNLKKKKSQEPEGKQVNDDLESLNSPIDNENNVESHSSANSGSNVVKTEHNQQLAKIITELSTIKTKINELEEEREEKLEEFDSRSSDLERGLGCLRQNLTKITECAEEYTQLKDNLQTITTKITECAEEHTQLKDNLQTITTKITECAEEHTQLKDNNLKTITEKYTQLQSELESMVTTELKKHESTLENRVKDLQKQFEGKNKELNSKYEKFLGASINSKRQGSYASISFVLSGASAVGASLTMFLFSNLSFTRCSRINFSCSRMLLFA